jgi:hypothetical protein
METDKKVNPEVQSSPELATAISRWLAASLLRRSVTVRSEAQWSLSLCAMNAHIASPWPSGVLLIMPLSRTAGLRPRSSA